MKVAGLSTTVVVAAAAIVAVVASRWLVDLILYRYHLRHPLSRV